MRSHLTLDDVDFTILAATSVLTDLMSNCPPAEACRDAFTRMAKATITMCMSTTGFGVASSLGSQTLEDSPVSYVSPGQLSNDGMSGSHHLQQHADDMQQRPSSGGDRTRNIPKFDMNLKDLFSDVELQGRTQSFFPQHQQNQYARQGTSQNQQQQQQQRQQQQDAAPFTGQTYAIPATPDTSAGTDASPMQYSQQPPDFNRHNSYNSATSYQPPTSLSQTISQQPPPSDFSFDTLDFLDTFPESNNNQNNNTTTTSTSASNNPLLGGASFWPSAEVDLGFGTGGLAGWSSSSFMGEGEDSVNGPGGGGGGVTGGFGGVEGVGAGGGGVDLFDGFFFGGGGGGGFGG